VAEARSEAKGGIVRIVLTAKDKESGELRCTGEVNAVLEWPWRESPIRAVNS
jgi:hypothetical protein